MEGQSTLWCCRFLCLPLRLPPWTVPCRIVLASPDDRVTCPYHFSLRLFTVVKRSSYGPMAFPILAFTSSLVMWSLYEILRSLRKHPSNMQSVSQGRICSGNFKRCHARVEVADQIFSRPLTVYWHYANKSCYWSRHLAGQPLEYQYLGHWY